MLLAAVCEIRNTSDRDYLDSLYRSYYPILHKLAAGIIRDTLTAGDIVTNAMLSLFSKIPDLRAMAELERAAYLKATVRNAAYKYYNGRTRQNLTEVSFDDALFSLPDQVDPAVLIEIDDEFEVVQEAIATLEQAERQVLHLKYSAQLTACEIAQIVNAPSEAVVHMRLSRARRKLLRLLEDWGWGDE